MADLFFTSLTCQLGKRSEVSEWIYPEWFLIRQLFNTSLTLSQCGLIQANDAPTDKAQAIKILEIIKKLTESNNRVDL